MKYCYTTSLDQGFFGVWSFTKVGTTEGFCLKATWSQSGERHYQPGFTINYTWERV